LKEFRFRLGRGSPLGPERMAKPCQLRCVGRACVSDLPVFRSHGKTRVSAFAQLSASII
jgi:hypothetical protein